MAIHQTRKGEANVLLNLTVNLLKRAADDGANVYSDYLISAVVSIIFLIFLSIMFATMLYKWVHGPNPIFIMDNLIENAENCYVVSLVTGYRSNKTITGSVVFSLNGLQGNSKDYEVSAEAYNVFGCGTHDSFHVCTPASLGKLIGVSVNLISKEKFEKWCLNYITVHDLSDSSYYYFQVNTCFTAVSGYSESVMAGKQTKSSLLLMHNIAIITKETFLWLSRFTTRHTDRPMDIISNICQCYLLVLTFMVLLLFYIKIDRENTVLFSSSYVFCLFIILIISSAFITFIQLTFRSHSLASSSVLENFSPVSLDRTSEGNRTQNNIESQGSWFESRMEVFTTSTEPVGSVGNISTSTIKSEFRNFNVNNSSNFSPEKTTSSVFVRKSKGRKTFNFKIKIMKNKLGNFIKMKSQSTATVELKKIKLKRMPWKEFRANMMRIQNEDSNKSLLMDCNLCSPSITMDTSNVLADDEKLTCPTTSGLKSPTKECSIRFRSHKIRDESDFMKYLSRINAETLIDEVETIFFNNNDCDILEAGLENFVDNLSVCHLKYKNYPAEDNIWDDNKIQPKDMIFNFLKENLEKSLNLEKTSEIYVRKKRTNKFTLLLANSFNEKFLEEEGRFFEEMKFKILRETERALFRFIQMSGKPEDNNIMINSFEVQHTQKEDDMNHNILEELFSKLDFNGTMLTRVQLKLVVSELWTLFIDEFKNNIDLRIGSFIDHLSAQIIDVILMEDVKEVGSKMKIVKLLRNTTLFLKRYRQTLMTCHFSLRRVLTSMSCSQISSIKRLYTFNKTSLKRCKSCSWQGVLVHEDLCDQSNEPRLNVICLLSHVMDTSDKNETRLKCNGCRRRFLKSCLTMKKSSVSVMEKIFWREVLEAMKECERYIDVIYKDFVASFHTDALISASVGKQFPKQNILESFVQRSLNDLKLLTNKIMDAVKRRLLNLLLIFGCMDRSKVKEVIVEIFKNIDDSVVEDLDVFVGEIETLAGWFVKTTPGENRCNHNRSTSDYEYDSSLEQDSNFPRPREMMTAAPSSSSSSSTSKVDPILGRSAHNFQNYESISTHSNQNAAPSTVKKMFSAFDMSDNEHKSRRNHFMEGIRDIPKNLRKVILFGLILLLILTFNLIVLAGGDSYVSKDGANILVISLFFACLFHVVIIEPIKILALSLYWTFKKRELFH